MKIRPVLIAFFTLALLSTGGNPSIAKAAAPKERSFSFERTWLQDEALRPHKEEWTKILGGKFDAEHPNEPFRWNANHPPYNQWILDKAVARTGYSLRFDMLENNAAAETTEFIPVDRNHSYRLAGWVKGKGLDRFEASIAVHFYSAANEAGRIMSDGQPNGFATATRKGTFDWQRLSALKKRVPPNARYAKIRCRVRGDGYSGHAWFDDIQLVTMPRIEIFTRRPGNLFVGNEPVELYISAPGIQEKEYTGRLQVTDWRNTTIWTSNPMAIRAGEASIRMPITHFGPCTTTLTLRGTEGTSKLTLPLGRIPEVAKVPLKGIGIDLEGANRFSKDVLALLATLRAGNVKVHLWADPKTLPAFLTQISSVLKPSDINGVFGHPPGTVQTDSTPAVTSNFLVFSTDPKRRGWASAVTQAVAGSMDVTDIWILGTRGDSSFLGKSSLARIIDGFKKAADNGIQLLQIAIPGVFHQIHEPLPSGVAAVDYAIPFQVAPREMAEAVRSKTTQGGSASIWVSLGVNPEDKKQSSALVDFAQKLVLAKVSGAQKVFVTAQPDLTTDEAIATKAYYVLRTLGQVVGNARYLGAIRLKNGSIAHIFDTQDKRAAIVWRGPAHLTAANQKPGTENSTEESVWWGSGLTVTDVMGNPVEVEKNVFTTTLKAVSPMPLVVTGIDPGLIDTQMSARLAGGLVESRREYQARQFTFTNHFDTSISGKASLQFPKSAKEGIYQLRRGRHEFSLAPGETFEMELDVKPPVGGTIGEKALTLNLDIDDKTRGKPAESPVAYRLQTEIEITTQIHELDQEQVEIVTRIHNPQATAPLSVSLYFRELDDPNSIAQVRTIRSIPAGATASRRFVTHKANLSGDKRVWIGLRERSGPRFANIHIAAEHLKQSKTTN